MVTARRCRDPLGPPVGLGGPGRRGRRRYGISRLGGWVSAGRPALALPEPGLVAGLAPPRERHRARSSSRRCGWPPCCATGTRAGCSPQVVGITTVVTMVLIGGVLTTASLAPCRARPDAERGGRLGARPVRGQPAVLPDRGLHPATAAGLPARRPRLPGCDADRGADRGGGPVAPAGGPDAGPAGPGRDHLHRARQHDDPAAAAAGADLPAREHRRDRARRQPSPAGRGPGHRGSRHDRQPVVPAGAPAGHRGQARLRATALVRAAGRRCGE